MATKARASAVGVGSSDENGTGRGAGETRGRLGRAQNLSCLIYFS